MFLGGNMWELIEKGKVIYSSVLKQDCIIEALKKDLLIKVSSKVDLNSFKLKDGVELRKR